MKERIERLQAALPEGIDAALITAQVNRRYYTGFPSSAGTLLVTRGSCTFFIDFRYYEAAQRTITGCEVVLQGKLAQQLQEAAAKNGVQTVGIETGYTTVEQVARFKEMLPSVTLLEDNRLNNLILAQRRIKSEDEIQKILAAQQLSEQALEKLLPSIKAGKTERELALELEYTTLKLGSQRAAFDFIVVGGPNSALPHGVPGDRPLQKGDLITFDFGSVVDGYCSDMTRTLALGQPAGKGAEIYGIVLRAQLAALEAVGPGVCCADVDKVARDIIEQAGYGPRFGHNLGHGLGLEVHEAPSFGQANQELCQPGMVMSVEPGIYLAGCCGCRIEDLVVVTEQGMRNLNRFPKELMVL